MILATLIFPRGCGARKEIDVFETFNCVFVSEEWKDNNTVVLIKLKQTDYLQC